MLFMGETTISTGPWLPVRKLFKWPEDNRISCCIRSQGTNQWTWPAESMVSQKKKTGRNPPFLGGLCWFMIWIKPRPTITLVACMMGNDSKCWRKFVHRRIIPTRSRWRSFNQYSSRKTLNTFWDQKRMVLAWKNDPTWSNHQFLENTFEPWPSVFQKRRAEHQT